MHLSNRRRAILRSLFYAQFAMMACVFVIGCGGSVTSDAEAVLTVISLAFGTAEAAVAFIPGAAAIQPILAAGSAIVASLQTQFKTFVANPTASAFQNLMGFVSQLNINLGQILAATGIPGALVTKLQAIFTVVQTQIQNWVSLVESLTKPGTTTASPALEAAAALPGTEIHAQLKTVQEAARGFHGELKTIVETHVGDEAVDAAFDQANKL